MADKLRLLAAGACGLCAIGVDFTSTLMSVVSDMFFIGALFVLVYPLLKTDE